MPDNVTIREFLEAKAEIQLLKQSFIQIQQSIDELQDCTERGFERQSERTHDLQIIIVGKAGTGGIVGKLSKLEEHIKTSDRTSLEQTKGLWNTRTAMIGGIFTVFTAMATVLGNIVIYFME